MCFSVGAGAAVAARIAAARMTIFMLSRHLKTNDLGRQTSTEEWRGLSPYHPRTYANTSGATILASLSITWLGVSTPSFPQVIFSFGTAPEYEP